LSEDRLFAIGASLAVLWTALLLNVVGLKSGKWLGNLGAVGTYGAALLLIAAGAVAWSTHGPATRLDLQPEWNWEKLNFWSQIAFAFGGLELGAILGGEIRDPDRTIPRAAWLSGFAIAFFYLAGTIAILALLPPDQINILTGLAQAGSAAGERLGIPWLSPVLAVLITAGVAGQLGAWLGGCARLPLVIGIAGHFPAVWSVWS
jgi:amino acid transporter